jgi:type II secretory pathway pseudopilin PulG
MKKSNNSKNWGFSLAEVLIGASIIAVAVFGIVLSLSAQQMADSRLRYTKVLKHLHYQLIRESLKHQRDGNIGFTLGTANLQLTNPAFDAGTIVYYKGVVAGSLITSNVHVEGGTGTAVTLASNSVTVYEPYFNGVSGWKNVQP